MLLSGNTRCIKKYKDFYSRFSILVIYGFNFTEWASSFVEKKSFIFLLVKFYFIFLLQYSSGSINKRALIYFYVRNTRKWKPSAPKRLKLPKRVECPYQSLDTKCAQASHVSKQARHQASPWLALIDVIRNHYVYHSSYILLP